MSGPSTIPVDEMTVHAFEVPTDGPDGKESDGTLEWSSTTIVVVELHGHGETGLGYTYGDVSVAEFIRSMLAPVALGADVSRPAELWESMHVAIRNAGHPGVGMMAVSAVDIAAWDLKSRASGLPLVHALPSYHRAVPIYGSGGFTNYPLARLGEQMTGWVEQGIPRVKLKTSRHPDEDPARLDAVRAAVGDGTEIFVDANGALGHRSAAWWAGRFAEEWDVRWFEEPVSSGDPAGLHFVRQHCSGQLEVAAGEYGYEQGDFAALLDAGAVDCLQADVTRCGGITGVLQVAGLSAAHHIDLSAHCAPAVSAHAFCAVRRLRHLEYFHDHVRLEGMLFDGTLPPVDASLSPDPGRPGLGLALRAADAEPYRIYGPARSAATDR